MIVKFKSLKFCLIPGLIILGMVFLVFRKYFVSNLLPIPFDLLVSFFFPFSSGGWAGYDPWTTHKEFIAADAIRQQLPWKIVALVDLWQKKLPLWNAHNFAGAPLLANFQSHIFYPFNLVYFILPLYDAWSLSVVIQPLLAGIFMLFYMRERKVDKWGALLSGLAFAFSSYMMVWWEINVIGQTLLWLPLILWAIEKLKKKSMVGWLILILGQTFSILAGHPLTAMMVSAISLGYLLFGLIEEKKIRKEVLIKYGLAMVIVALFVWPQLRFSFEFYQQSTLKQPFASQVFDKFLVPWRQLLTFFASDLFGNPAANNFWGTNYGDATPFLGVIPFFFALLALVIWRNRQKWFWLILVLLGILGAIKSPASDLIKLLKLPLLSSTAPARLLILPLVSLAVLSGIGLHLYLNKRKKYQKKFARLWLIFGLVYLSLVSFSLIRWAGVSDMAVKTNSLVSLKNLVLPTAIYLALGWFLLEKRLAMKDKRFKKVIDLAVVFLPTLLGILYYTNKYLPFSSRVFAYPDHQIIRYIQGQAGYNRYFGQGLAYFGDNFASAYGIYSAEGYDVMVLDRYAQLIASVDEGTIPDEYPRSDAVLPSEDSYWRQRLMNLLGIKFVLDKNDFPQSEWEPDFNKFPPDRFKLVWQRGKFKVYENLEALARAFLVSDYMVATEPNEIIKLIYDEEIDLRQTVILEEELPEEMELKQDWEGKAEIADYQNRKVEIKTKSRTNQLLFLSDNFYPGWKVFIDGLKTKLYRADFTFRAVLVPAGEHMVVFKY